jgi:hypothetical protein
MRFLFVKKGLSEFRFNNGTKIYEGMNRPKLGSFLDVPESILYHGLALEDLPSNEAEKQYQNLVLDMLAMGINQYELLALDGSPLENYEFLGYDVGETTKTAWSAILHKDIFLNPEEINQWEQKLNVHELFQEQEEAEEFLARYLESDDPDMGWTADGWTDIPDFYAVIPVYRYYKNL